ncbi:MAG: DndE family protein, partial [Bacteroidales bacterium]|nr:DndE family protein [Bacteroidales bacterium]
MQINIKTSDANQAIVSNLTQKLPGGAKENIIARMALGYSISTGKRFTTQEFGRYNSQGKEYKDNILFDSAYRDYYIALVCQAYGIDKNDELIPKYVKLHIDHGLEQINLLFESRPQYTFFDFLIEYLGKGIDMIEDAPVSLEPVRNNSQHITKTSFAGPIDIKIGYSVKDRQPIKFCFNNKIYNNQHIAVAGKSGSGKTQFALDFLRQLVAKTQGRVNFLFLDFKGVSMEDRAKMADFFTETHTTCINAPDDSFPLNPLSFIDNVNEKNKIVGINKFVDIIARYSNIGKKQQQTLREATQEAFRQQTSGSYPSFQQINDLILQQVGDIRDTLTELMGRLSDYELFSSHVANPSEFLNKNYYLSLSGEFDSTIRFTSVFLIINYIFNVFSNMGQTDVIDDHREMRYVLAIDEAHDLFREKKSLEILETILRKIRSYGVSVFLLSQGIAEYNTASFDFSQECETSFLLPINDLNNTKAINKFLGVNASESKMVLRSLESLTNGQAISNVKGYGKIEPFEVV